DTWLAAAFAEYERIVAGEKAINARGKEAALAARDRERIELALFEPASRYLTAVARRGGKDMALAETRAELRADEWYDIASGKGVLILAELRRLLGDDRFVALMASFGRTHAGHAVSTATFFEAAEKAHGKPLAELKDAWLNGGAIAKLGGGLHAR